MYLSKDLFTVRRAALAAAVVAGVVAPSMALRALTTESPSTTVEVALRPAAARGGTTSTSQVTAAATSSGAVALNPFRPTATAATTVAAIPAPPAPATATVTVPPAVTTTWPPPVTTTVPPPPSGPGNASSYAFATYPSGANFDKSPIRWSPLATIHYRINPGNAPPGAMADLTQALAMLKVASGLNLVNDGSTLMPTDNANACTPPTAQTCWFNNIWTPLADGTGSFPPVLIGWSPPSAPIMSSNVAGATLGRVFVLPRQTSAMAPSVAGDFELVSGIVVFSSSAAVPGGFGGSSRGVVMLHELGALVGLTNVTDPDQMMFSALNGHVASYGAGDLAGLKLAGPAGHGVSYTVQPRV